MSVAMNRSATALPVGRPTETFGARGYFVSTVGREEEVIRRYIRNQEIEDMKQEKLQLEV